ncbi:hypothetical protein OF83DRAFT_1179439 [Amylostereum chailletii]|nr:hypothetical protein OF83DRAFT_1179439 [Amylostereum chailletii]
MKLESRYEELSQCYEQLLHAIPREITLASLPPYSEPDIPDKLLQDEDWRRNTVFWTAKYWAEHSPLAIPTVIENGVKTVLFVRHPSGDPLTATEAKSLREDMYRFWNGIKTIPESWGKADLLTAEGNWKTNRIASENYSHWRSNLCGRDVSAVKLELIPETGSHAPLDITAGPSQSTSTAPENTKGRKRASGSAMTKTPSAKKQRKADPPPGPPPVDPDTSHPAVSLAASPAINIAQPVDPVAPPHPVDPVVPPQPTIHPDTPLSVSDVFHFLLP